MLGSILIWFVIVAAAVLLGWLTFLRLGQPDTRRAAEGLVGR